MGAGRPRPPAPGNCVTNPDPQPSSRPSLSRLDNSRGHGGPGIGRGDSSPTVLSTRPPPRPESRWRTQKRPSRHRARLPRDQSTTRDTPPVSHGRRLAVARSGSRLRPNGDGDTGSRGGRIILHSPTRTSSAGSRPCPDRGGPPPAAYPPVKVHAAAPAHVGVPARSVGANARFRLLVSNHVVDLVASNRREALPTALTATSRIARVTTTTTMPSRPRATRLRRDSDGPVLHPREADALAKLRVRAEPAWTVQPLPEETATRKPSSPRTAGTPPSLRLGAPPTPPPGPSPEVRLVNARTPRHHRHEDGARWPAAARR